MTSDYYMSYRRWTIMESELMPQSMSTLRMFKIETMQESKVCFWFLLSLDKVWLKFMQNLVLIYTSHTWEQPWRQIWSRSNLEIGPGKKCWGNACKRWERYFYGPKAVLISLESSLVSVSRQTKTKTLAIRIKVEVALLETRIVQYSGQIEMEATHVGLMEV